jgi:hypothetical protein
MEMPNFTSWPEWLSLSHLTLKSVAFRQTASPVRGDSRDFAPKSGIGSLKTGVKKFASTFATRYGTIQS